MIRNAQCAKAKTHTNNWCNTYTHILNVDYLKNFIMSERKTV